jgi:hypothetical protein
MVVPTCVRSLSLVWLGAACAWGQIITTIAGTDWSYPANPLPAVSAPLAKLEGLASDVYGNVYIADVADDCVVRVGVDGVSRVVAGQNAPVLFAGLTPGFTGLYQIIATMPPGVPPDDQVPVTINVGGQLSAPVVISTR